MKTIRHVEFTGSYFWLVFWVVVLFPVGALYFVLKSFVVEEQVEDEGLGRFLRGRHDQPWYSRSWAG
jgi:hypothetical protein